jgi:RimJ/RimL family protein N-acetyltransferase
MKNSFGTGNKIYLRPASISDAKGNWYKWLNDREITKYLTERFWPNTKELQIQFVKNNISARDRLIFSICLKNNDKHVGQCALSYINWIQRYANISIIIGEKKFRKGTIALESYNLLLQIAFERFNLLNVKSSLCNPIAEKYHNFLGFKKVGIYKKLFFIDNKYFDFKLYILSRKDWLRKNKK